ncbi:MAG: MarR family winged helix-turn-helix transcriptional regulator [Acidimicrobiia bacterium]
MTARSQEPFRGKADRVNVRRRAWRAIMVTHGMITPLLDEELRDGTDLDLQTYDALLHTYEAGDPGIRMTDLAQNVVLSKSGLTTLVDRLEERGLLQRIADPEDRRTTRITLTPQGMDTFRNAAKVHVASIQKHFTDLLTDDEAKVIAEALERIHPETRSPNPEP